MRRPWPFLLLLLTCLHPSRVTRTARHNESVLEVMTYNVNFGIAGDHATARVLEESSAELVLLQETTPEWEAAVRKKLSPRYPHQAWHHSAGAGGLAVLSRRPFTVEDVLPSSEGWFPAVRLLAQTSLGSVQVLVVHLRPPISDSGSWVSGYLTTSPLRRDELKEHLRRLSPNLPTLVAGDFNEGTSGDAVSELESRGFRSVLPEFDPGAQTWGWQVGRLQLSAQLDHVTYTKELEPIDARVIRAGNSDHFAVLARFVRATSGFQLGPSPRGGSLSVSVH